MSVCVYLQYFILCTYFAAIISYYVSLQREKLEMHIVCNLEILLFFFTVISHSFIFQACRNLAYRTSVSIVG